MSATSGIFSGLRILELGAGAAGPVATRYFAEQGATVVRIESLRRPDFLRTIQLRPGDGAEALDRAPMFVLLNPNKKSVALNLAEPRGRELALRLALWADVVCENFAPGVMDRWGLGADTLRDRKPELIVASGCLFGQTGPQRHYPGFGGQGAAIAGFNHLAGREDGEAHGPYGTITDSLAPRYLALVIAAALLRRRQTGRGTTIDLSQIETGVYSLSEMIVRASAGDDRVGRRGNHDERAAPHAIYPCRGEDRWIAIAVLSDAQWLRLRRAMGDPPWAARPAYDHAAARLAEQDEIDRRIAEWTAKHDAYALMQALQAAGVEAGVVQTYADLHADPQLAHRGHFVELVHARLGRMTFEQSGFRLQRHPARLDRPGPLLGEHTREVLGEALGLSAAEIDALVDAEVAV